MPQVSPIQVLEVPGSSVVLEAQVPPPTDDASKSVSPHAADAIEPVPPPDGEAAEDAKLEPFG